MIYVKVIASTIVRPSKRPELGSRSDCRLTVTAFTESLRADMGRRGEHLPG